MSKDVAPSSVVQVPVPPPRKRNAPGATVEGPGPSAPRRPMSAVRPVPEIQVPEHMSSMAGAAPARIGGGPDLMGGRAPNVLFDGPGPEVAKARQQAAFVRQTINQALMAAAMAVRVIDESIALAAESAEYRAVFMVEALDLDQLKRLRQECSEIVEGYKPKVETPTGMAPTA